MELLSLLLSALSQGAIYAPMAMGVYIAFKVLNSPDLTIDGSMVFGMTICAVITIPGHPVLALFGSLLAGAAAGFCTGFLQTKLQIHPILSGILTMTGLYTVNYAVLGGQSNRYLQYETVNESGSAVNNTCDTIYRLFTDAFSGILGTNSNTIVLVLTLLIVALAGFLLCGFFKTRPGLAIRATGDNEEMVRSSSINADAARITGIMISNALVALSGGLLCQQQKYADLNNGSGMLVVGLASVIIGQALFGRKGGVTAGIISAALGSFIYRIILQAAYKIDMPSYFVKLLSAVIVVIALSLPLLQQKSRLIQQQKLLRQQLSAGQQQKPMLQTSQKQSEDPVMKGGD